MKILDQAIKDILLKRAEIIEQYLKTWVAANIPDDQLSPEMFNNFTLVERKMSGGDIHFFVVPKDKFEKHLSGLHVEGEK